MHRDRPQLALTKRHAFACLVLLLPLAASPARAQLCANPGQDGPGGTLTGVVNTYYPGTATVAAGSISIPVGTASGAATPIAAGDLLLVIQMQDAAVNSTNSDAYGDGVAGAPASGSSGLNNAGRYEFVVATGPVAAGFVPVIGEGVGNGLLYTYTNAAASGTQGQRRFQVIRVPQYSSATLSSGLTGLPWNGTLGGAIAIDVAGVVNLGGATISMSGRGFRGGAGRGLGGQAGGANTDYRSLAANAYHGSKGEGIAGTPRYVLDPIGGTQVNTGVDGYPNGSSARGAPGNAGGGGTDGNPAANDENSGGGGGGNGGIGGGGGNTWNSNLARGGYGGTFTPAADRIVMGGGGGAGARNNSSGVQSSGGAGGGIVVLRAGSVSGTGTITTDGITGPVPANDGGGGGGAGGSVVVFAASGSLAGLTVNARGANGSNADVGGSAHGPGGGGGGGFVELSSAATTNVSGGTAGYTVAAGNNYGATAGTSGATVTTLAESQMPGQGPGALCVPVLAVVKTTSTPAVTNTATGTTATYSISVSNTGGSAASQVSVTDSLPSGFTYASTGSVTLNGGATRPSTTGPAVGDSILAFTSFSIPAGGSVTITFTVDVATSVAPGTYQNPARATYLDAARTAANGTTSSAYAPLGSNGEDVTVRVPDLTIDKRHTAGFTVGSNGTYTFVVRNVGSAATTGAITVRDTLPAGLTFVSGAGAGWTVGNAAQVVTATNAGPIAAGDSLLFTVNVTVGATALPSVTNSATVSGGGDYSPANNRDSDPTAVTGVPDLTIDKRHTVGFTDGANGTYTFVIRNIGSAATTGTITVRDTLPAGLTFVSSAGAGWTIGNAAQVVTATNPGPIAAGDSLAFTVTVAVGAAAVPSVTNSATVSGGGDTTPANNRDSDPTAVAGVPDLALTKSAASAFAVGSNATYRLSMRNVGSAATAGTITVRDTLPAGLTFVSGSGTGWTVTAVGQVVTATNPGPVAAADSSFYTLTVTVGAAAVPSVTNNATVSGGGDVNPANNRGSATTPVTGLPDLTVDKRHTVGFTDGVNGTYTFVIRNVGSAATAGTITVRDTLPAGLTFVSGVGAGWTIGNAAQVVTATNPGPIAAGDSLAFTVTVAVGAAAVPSVTNSATVSGGGDTTPANNRDSDPTAVAGVPDLALTKSAASAFAVGSNATYRLSMRNVGSAATAGTITVRDTLPAGLTFVSGTGTGWTVTAVGQVVTATNPGPVAAADSSFYTLTVAVGASAIPSVTNNATVSGGGDVNASNNRGSATTPVTGLPDLTIDKRHTVGFTDGSNGTYTFVIRNVGSAATSGTITVRDTLPAGLTFVSGVGAGWTIGNAAQVVTATNAGPIAAGDSLSFTVTVAVGAAAVPSVTNNATVSGGGDVTPANNRDSDPTAVTGVPDLALTKSAASAFAVGSNATYRLSMRNVGSAATAGAITVRDTLPAGLTFVSGTGAGWTVTAVGQVVTATSPGPVAAADSSFYTLTVAVGAAAVPSITNNATVSGGGDVNASNNRGSATTPVTGLPDLTIDKRHTVGFTDGANGTYTFVIRNIGSAATTGTITVRDTLPAGLTFVSGAGAGWTIGNVAQVVTATNAGPIAAGDSLAFTVTVAVGAAAVPSVTNSATVSGGGDVTPANNRDSDPTAVTGVPDLALTKSAASGFVVGSNATYRLSMRNVGSAATSGAITVRDTLPAGLTFVSGVGTGWTVTAVGQVVTATNPGPVAAADSSFYTLTVAVGAGAVPSVTNNATVSGGSDVNPGNNRGSATTPVGGTPDLTIDKRHTVGFTDGSNGTYTFVIRNIGSAATTGTITVRDTLPAGLAFVSGAGAGWTIGNAAQVVAAANAGPIAAGDSLSFNVTVTVGAAAVPSVTNSATVSGGGDTTPNNNRDSDPTTVTGVPDLALIKSAASAFAVGSNATYRLSMRNVGSATTAGAITVRDTLPAGLTFGSGVGTGWTVTAVGQVVTATNPGPVAAADSSFYTLTVAVGAGAVPSVTNNATVSGGSDVNPGNNRGSATTPVGGTPDLTIDKRHTVGFTVGANGVYTLVVRNLGPGVTAGAITVRDTLPAGLTFVSGAGTGWTVAAVGQVVTATNPGPILAADSSLVTLTVTAGAAAAPSVTNSATVSGGGDVTPANNRDSDPTAVAGAPDLALFKSAGSVFTVGANATYRIAVVNVGTQPAPGILTVRDTLPAGLTFVSATAPAWTIINNVPVVTGFFVGPLAAGDSAVIMLTVAVNAAAAPSVTNSATVSGGNDNSPGNNRGSATTPVNGLPDLTVDKRHTAGFSVGANGTYTLVVRNSGLGSTSGTITVRDTLPAGLTFVSGAGAGWTIGNAAQVVTATNAGPIAIGDSLGFTLTVAVGASAAPSVTNAATVSGGGDVTPANNRDTDPTAVSTAPDLALTKSAASGFVVGSNATYRLSLRNVGSAATAGAITVRDTLPAGLSFVSGTGTGWTVTAAGQVVTATNPGPVASADSSFYTLTVAVGAAAVPSVTNNATVSGGGDTNAGNNRGSATTPVGGTPDLTVDKRHTAGFTVGANGTYTLVVRNVGTAATAGTISVRDTLPAGLTFVSGAGAGWTVGNAAQVVTATNAGPIAAGDSLTFTVTVAVGAAAVPSVTNSATVSGGGDATPANNRDSDPTAVTGAPDLALTKSAASTFAVGSNATYRLSLRNVGSTATSGAITVRDTLPAGLTFVSGAGTGWTVTASGQVVTATNPGPVAAADSSFYTLTVAVALAAAPGVTNNATVSGGGDASPGNNRGSATAPVGGTPDLTVDKRHGTGFIAGGTGFYTLVVRNVGTVASSGTITVRDTLPAGLTFFSSSAVGWTVGIAGQVFTATNPASIAAGDSLKFSITVAVGDAAVPSVTNTATVSGGGDVTPANNRDSDPTAVTGVPDLALTKSASSVFAVGSSATYRLSMRNVGSAATSGAITVRDTLPAGLTFVSGAGTGWTVTGAGQLVTATNAGPVAAADSSFYTLTVAVGAAASPSVTNNATVSGGGEINTTNNRGSAMAPVGGAPDLTVDKRHTTGFTVGAPGVYTLVVRNVGLVPTTGTITVRDTLPAGLTFASGTGAGWTIGNAAQVVTATHPGPIATGDSLKFTLTVVVGATAVPSVTNRATVSGGGDTTPANDTDTDPAQVIAAPDLSLDKRHTTAFAVTQPGTWTIVVRNVGSSPTTGAVTVRDTLPTGVTYTGATGAGWTFAYTAPVLVATHAGLVAAGDSVSLNVNVTADANAPANLVNSATAATPGDVNPANDRDADPVSVAGGVQIVLGVQKSASPTVVELGGVVDYTVRVSNTGSGIVDSARVVDHLPAGFRYQSGTTRLDGAAIADPAGSPGPQLLFILGAIPSGGQRLLTYRVTVGAGAGLGTGINTAVAQATGAGGSLLASAVASARVQVKGGAFADDGIIAGKVYADCDCATNGVQGPEELGIPGVRVLLEDGTAAITDAEGKYSFNHVAPRLHVIRVDESTLPTGARLGDDGTRNAGQAHSRFVDLYPGELHRADFREVSGDEHVLSRIRERRVQGEVSQAMSGAAEDKRLTDRLQYLLELGHGLTTADSGSVAMEPRSLLRPNPLADLGNSSVSVLDPSEGRSGSAVVPTTPAPVCMFLSAPSQSVPADGTSRVPVHAKLDEKAGQVMTIETTAGRIEAKDDDPIAPGAQTTVVGSFGLIAPSRPGEALVRVTAGDVSDSVTVRFVQPSHPLLLSGVVEGRFDSRSLRSGELDGTSRDGFEAALLDARSTSREGRTSESGRGALFATGDLVPGTTLTGRFDTEADREHRVFRDLRPFEGYDLLGDASVHEWNAQSDSRLYLRLDRGASFAQFGDFTTPMRSAQRLGAFQRSMTGAVAHVDGERAQVSGFATEGRSHQVVDELPGMGISGPYALSRADGTLGSEQIEIVVRDRNQPSRILSRQPMVRFADYTVEPFTGRLLFRRPVPSVDGDLNPVSVRVTYEAQSAGDAFWIYGAQAAASPTRALTLGVSAARDEDPGKPTNLASVDATLAPAPGVRLVGEFARSDSGTTFLSGDRHGEAWRGELSLDRTDVNARVYALRADRTFDNPSAGVSAGRSELGAQVRLPLGAGTSLFANGLRSEDLVTHGRRDGAEFGATHALGERLSAEAAFRWAEETAVAASAATLGASPNDTRSLRGRLTAQLPAKLKSTAFAEFEQDLSESDQQRYAVGADAQVAPRTRLYARHENVASFAGPFALNGSQQLAQTVVGVASDELRDGQVFTEYRARDAFAGRDAQAAFGLRNRWAVSPGLRLDASFERVTPLSGADSSGMAGKATSVTGGMEWTRDPLWKGTARVELRSASSTDQWLFTAGASRKLGRDWAALGRAEWLAIPDVDRTDRRTQLGLAYRETDANRWNALARWENRLEVSDPVGTPRTETSANVLSAHVNVKPAAHWTLSGQGAAKWARDEANGLVSTTTTQLLGGRAMVDLTRRFDAGVTGRVLSGGGGDQKRWGTGAELGVMLGRGVRGAFGYNAFGFKDDGLGVDHTDRGPYVQLGAKFDEATFGLGRK